MTGDALLLESFPVKKTNFCRAARGMPGVTIDATGGVLIRRFPKRQVYVPVALKSFFVAFSSSDQIFCLRDISFFGDGFVTLQAVFISDRNGQGSWLDGGACKPLDRIAGAHQLRFYPACNSTPRMTVDTANFLAGMARSQVYLNGCEGSQIIFLLRLGVTGRAKRITRLLRGGEGKSCCQ